MNIIPASSQNDEHIASIVEMRNEYRECFFDQNKVTIESTKAFLESCEKSPNGLFFLVEEPITKGSVRTTITGMFSIYRIDMHRKDAEFGRIIYIGNDSKQLVSLIKNKLQEVAAVFNLDWYYLSTFEWNKKAIMFFNKLGFTIKQHRADEHIFCMDRQIIKKYYGVE